MYDYWFTQFDFPDENGKPYRSSGGAMVWNDQLKRDIPLGWNVKTVADIINVSNEKISPKDISDRYYVPIEVIPRRCISFCETASKDKALTGLCAFDKNAILLSNRRVYFHKVSIAPFNGVTRDTVIILKPKIIENLGFAFQVINDDHFIEYATKNSYGTEQPVLATSTVLEYLIPYSSNQLDLLYSQSVQPMIDKVLQLQNENHKLIALRDWLLPMLMNGQTTISD